MFIQTHANAMVFIYSHGLLELLCSVFSSKPLWKEAFNFAASTKMDGVFVLGGRIGGSEMRAEKFETALRLERLQRLNDMQCSEQLIHCVTMYEHNPPLLVTNQCSSSF